jgi:hypothetical protein
MVEDLAAELKSLETARGESSSSSSSGLYTITEDEGQAASQLQQQQQPPPEEDLLTVESLFGIRDPRRRPSSGRHPIGKKWCESRSSLRYYGESESSEVMKRIYAVLYPSSFT